MSSSEDIREFRKTLSYWALLDALTQGDVPSLKPAGASVGNSSEHYAITVSEKYDSSLSTASDRPLVAEISKHITSAIKKKSSEFSEKERGRKKAPKRRTRSSFDYEEAIHHLNEYIDGSKSLAPDSIDVFLGIVPREPIVKALLADEDGKRKDIEAGQIAVALLHLNYEGVVEKREGEATKSRPAFELSPAIWKLNHKGYGAKYITDACRETAEAIEARLERQYGTRQLSSTDLDAICRDYIDPLLAICPELSESSPDAPMPSHIVRICYAAHEDKADAREQERLVSTFYQADINDLEETLEKSTSDNQAPGESLRLVLSYLEGGLDSTSALGERVDILNETNNSSEHRDLLPLYQEMLSIDNTPLGRWPNKHQLSLMQQTAVNLAAGHRHDTDCTHASTLPVKNIMTVNGPPGTGKTTLLKDIVAANIVEKAWLLAQLNKPDDLFEAVTLSRTYLKYAPKVYSLKDDPINEAGLERLGLRIANLGIIVCSSNNAAVENISKELPNGQDLLDGVDEVEKLIFEGISDSEGTLPDLHAMEWAREEEYSRDLYFSYAADSQFGKTNPNAYRVKDPDTAREDLGLLIAARLGNRSNIKAFCQNCLDKIIFAGRNEAMRNQHKSNLDTARKAFRGQYGKVKDLMHKVEDKHRRLKTEEQALNDLITREETWRSAHEYSLFEYKAASNEFEEPFQRSIEELSIKIELLGDHRIIRTWDDLLAYRAELNDCVSHYHERRKECQGAVDRAENATFLNKTLHRKQYERDVEYAKAALEAFERTTTIDRELASLLDAINDICDGLKSARERQLMAKRELERIEAQNPANDLQSQQALVARLTNDCPSYFDRAKLDELLDVTSSAGKEMQLFNPLRVDQEQELPEEIELRHARDLLFLRALQFTREFILSSKEMNFNLRHLSAYLGNKQCPMGGTGDKRISYEEEDGRRIAKSLFQTLSILTPVISTTFASVHNMFRDVPIRNGEHAPFGLLIIDEAGQAVPHAALGALARCNRAIIVGDPYQIEPVVTHEVKMFSDIYGKEIPDRFKCESASVQSIADAASPIGSYNGEDGDEWVGCPLVVHRRCISPMFDISNTVSYGGRMINRSAPPKAEKAEKFCLPSSQWFNISGIEKGRKDHFVREQGEQARKLVIEAFELANPSLTKEDRGKNTPNLFIIAPFNSVVQGMRKCLGEAPDNIDADAWKEFKKNKIGTVHKFQGQEADEVIFILGCDVSTGTGAIDFVRANIVNVAASRAKYRLYAIGDIEAWYRNDDGQRGPRNNTYVRDMKRLIDDEWLKTWKHFREQLDKPDLDEAAKKHAKQSLVKMLPPGISFLRALKISDPPTLLNGECQEYCIDSTSFFNLFGPSMQDYAPSKTTCKRFGFADLSEVESFFSPCIDKKGKPDYALLRHVCMGMFEFEILDIDEHLAEANADSEIYDELWKPCTVMFCLAAELLLKHMLLYPMQQINPDVEYRPGYAIGEEESLNLGQYKNALKKRPILQGATQAYRAGCSNSDTKDTDREISPIQETWWNRFANSLDHLSDARCAVCHSGDGKPPKTENFFPRFFHAFAKGKPDDPPMPLFDQVPILAALRTGVESEGFFATQDNFHNVKQSTHEVHEAPDTTNKRARSISPDASRDATADYRIDATTPDNASRHSRSHEQEQRKAAPRPFTKWMDDPRIKTIVPSRLQRITARKVNDFLKEMGLMSQAPDKKGRLYNKFTPEALEKWGAGMIENNVNEDYGSSSPRYTFEGFRTVLNFYAECKGIDDRV